MSDESAVSLCLAFDRFTRLTAVTPLRPLLTSPDLLLSLLFCLPSHTEQVVKPAMPGTKAMKSSATTSKPKKEKDPNAPKRPQSAYFLFTADKRPQLKANCPDMKVTEVAKECGRLWKLVTPNEKKKYDALAAEDKERYEREMKDYNKN